MLHPIFNDSKMMLPADVLKAAAALPLFLQAEDPRLISTYTADIARGFNATDSFYTLVNGSPCAIAAYQQHLITSFEKNVRLLIEKTWVDKSAEEFKDDTLYRLETFCKSVASAAEPAVYATLLPECIAVLRDVVMLLFGSQTSDESFLEYAVRIDPDFGVFWYYIECFTNQKQVSFEKSRIAIFLGMCFLANF